MGNFRFTFFFCSIAVTSSLTEQCATARGLDDPGALLSRVRSEAAKLERVPASDVFGLLTSDAGGASLELTRQQFEFCRRLGELIQAVLKAELTAGLNEKSPPKASDLAARLDAGARRRRQSIVDHAEAMALEMILTADQSGSLRKAARRKQAPLLAGRNGRYRLTGRFLPVESLDSVGEEIEQELGTLRHGRATLLFSSLGLLVANPGIKAAETAYRLRGLSEPPRLPDQLAEIQKAANGLQFSSAQLELFNRLDKLSRDVLLARLSAELAAVRRKLDRQLPPDSDLAALAWFENWHRRYNSFSAHADAILLRGVMTARQADSFVAFHWKTRATSALADPLLASRLKLSRAQRARIDEAILERIPLIDAAGSLMGLKESPGKLDALGHDVSVLASEEERRLVSEADWIVWSVLTPSQLKEFSRITGRVIQDAPERAGE